MDPAGLAERSAFAARVRLRTVARGAECTGRQPS